MLNDNVIVLVKNKTTERERVGEELISTFKKINHQHLNETELFRVAVSHQSDAYVVPLFIERQATMFLKAMFGLCLPNITVSPFARRGWIRDGHQVMIDAWKSIMWR